MISDFKNLDTSLRASGWIMIRSYGSQFMYKKLECPYPLLIAVCEDGHISQSVLKKVTKMTG